MMNLGHIWALCKKDLLLLTRDKTGMFFTFLFPVGFALFFGMIFGGAGGAGKDAKIDVAVVDLDRSEASAKFAARLRADESLRVHVPPAESDAEPMAWAEKMVLTRTIVAFIAVEPGFGKGQDEMFMGGQGLVRVGADPSRTAERGMLQGILMKHAYSGMSDTFSKPEESRKQTAKAREMVRASKDLSAADRVIFETFFGAMDTFMARAQRGAEDDAKKAAGAGEAKPGSGFAFEPVKVTFEEVKPKRTLPANAFAVSFPQGLVWGVMGAAMGFAVAFIGERRSGTFARLVCSPMPSWALIAGKALACFLTILAAMSLMLVLASFLGVRLDNTLTLIVALLVVAFAFVGIMALLAVIAPTERSASGLGWAVMMVLAFVGGAAVPTFAMPGWMQSVSNISPMAWSMRCLEGGVWRGASVADIAVPALALVGLGGAGLVFAVWSLKRVAVK